MKNVFQMIVLLSGIVGFQFLVGCNDDDAQKVRIEQPCGTINPDVTNVSILIQNDLNVGNIGIVVDDSEQELSLSGRDFENGKLFSCWQTVPIISSSSTVVLIYELDGEVIVGTISVSDIQSNQLVIEIDGDSAMISDYEVCNDTPIN